MGQRVSLLGTHLIEFMGIPLKILFVVFKINTLCSLFLIKDGGRFVHKTALNANSM